MEDRKKAPSSAQNRAAVTALQCTETHTEAPAASYPSPSLPETGTAPAIGSVGSNTTDRQRLTNSGSINR